jgi:putative transposase
LWAGRLDKIMATRKRHSPEQVVRKLMTADRLLAEGKDTAAVCRELGVAEATYHRWRNQFGGLTANDAKRLKDLERENATLVALLSSAPVRLAPPIVVSVKFDFHIRAAVKSAPRRSADSKSHSRR